MGWIINLRKSRLQPLQVFNWLGVHWDLRSNTCCLPQETSLRAHQLLMDFLQSPITTLWTIMRLQEFINWCAQTDFSYRTLLPLTRLALNAHRRVSLDTRFRLPLLDRVRSVAHSLIPSIPRCLGSLHPDLLVMMDASSYCWGIKFPNWEF